MARNFAQDFVIRVIVGMDRDTGARVAVAMDCAIAYGALEYRDGNESLRALTDKDYEDKIKRLKSM